MDNTSFFAADLESADLSYNLLNGVDLRNTKLMSTNFRDAAFVGANMQSVDLGQVYLERASFAGGSDLRWSDFTSIAAPDLNIENSYLYGATLDQASFARASFESLNMTTVSALSVSMPEASIQNSDITDGNFWNATLNDAEFRNSNMQRINLTYTNLRDAILDGNNLTSARFNGADLTGAQLTSTIDSANVSSATLDGASLAGVSGYQSTFLMRV